MAGNYFIVNPAAGHGRAGKFWEGIKDRALRLAPGSGCAITEKPGQASELAEKAALGGAEKIIAVGGDGTFCEALEGVLAVPAERRRAALGAFPAGSGCDLARHLGCPRDGEGLLAMLARGTVRPIDAGRVHYTKEDGSPGVRHFINIAAFGLAGDVAHHIKEMGKPLGGTVSYAVSSLLSIAGARARELRLLADGREISGRYHLGVLANTSSMGGGMLVAPGAKDDDGRMDLVLVADMSRLALARKFPLLYRGTHLDSPGVSLVSLRRLEADSDETVYLNIDGEAGGRLPASFEVLPRAVSILAP
ncbi:MAG: diacylglycerol kinase family lipid kinase [Elusimicrobiales bacterium]|nr:diacylglycerol kinase family lipid kinase [Elusimicrobiales bacterium]